jgi:hypothetical protein
MAVLARRRAVAEAMRRLLSSSAQSQAYRLATVQPTLSLYGTCSYVDVAGNVPYVPRNWFSTNSTNAAAEARRNRDSEILKSAERIFSEAGSHASARDTDAKSAVASLPGALAPPQQNPELQQAIEEHQIAIETMEKKKRYNPVSYTNDVRQTIEKLAGGV